MARDESPQPRNRFCGPLVLQSAAAAMADTMMPGHGCTRPRTSPGSTPKRRAGTQSSRGLWFLPTQVDRHPLQDLKRGGVVLPADARAISSSVALRTGSSRR